MNSRTKFFSCAALVAALSCHSAGAQVQQAWVARHNGALNNEDMAIALAIDDAGNVSVKPEITTQPTNQSVFVEYYVAFSVTATGQPPPSYQWRCNDVDLPNATTSTLEFYSVTTYSAGNYSVVVSNSVGVVTSAVAVLTVIVEAPVITAQPTNQTASLGAAVQFMAGATGHPTPWWDWRLNGRSLGQGGSGVGGGTVQTYLSVSAGLGDAGEYTAVFSNYLGSVTSAIAVLTIREQAPVFTIQPPGYQSVFVGDEASFRAQARANPASAYQWYFHGPPIVVGSNAFLNVGQPLPGETNALLHLTQVTTNAEGAYCVIASNSVGSVTSYVAWLTVAWPSPLDRWQWRNPTPQGNHLRGITYGNGQFLGVGLAGTLVNSVDGENWTRLNVDPSAFLWAVAYGNGLFVAVGGSGPTAGPAGTSAIYTSVDGVNWVRRESGDGRFLYGVAFGNGVFVAVGDAFGSRDRILTSADGVTWAGQSTGPSYALQSVAYGNGLFVAVGADGVVQTSVNGTDWESSYSGVPYLYGVTYGNGVFAAVGNNFITSSTDGSAWTNRSMGSAPYLNLFGVAYGNGTFAAVGYDHGTYRNDGVPVVYTCTNGTDWIRQLPGGRSALLGLAFGTGSFMAVGDDGTILSSLTGSTWAPRSLGSTNALFGVAFGPDGVVAVGDFGSVLSSPDGVEWTPRSSGTTNNLNAVAWGRSNFVAVGTAGAILTSSNGLGWTRQDVGTNFNLRAVTFGRDQFVAVGGRLNPFEGPPPIFTSPDGATWTSRNSPLFYTLNGIAYGNGLFVVVSDQGTAGRSSDGITWTNGGGILGGPNLRTASAITFGNGTFVVTHYDLGYGASVVTSTDGVVWIPRFSHQFQHFSAAAYGDGAFVCVGDPDYMFAVTTLDGAYWTSVRPQFSSYLYGIGYGRGTFVAVGSGGTILQSADTRPRLTGSWSGAGFELNVSGGFARSYGLQASSDPATTHWADLLSFINVLPGTKLVDSTATNFSRRFYRAVSP